MKRFISLFIISLVAAVSCNVLDNVKDLSHYTADSVWSDQVLAKAYVTNLYANTFGTWPQDGGNSDENIGIQHFDVSITTAGGSFKTWNYSSIRLINVAIQNLQESPMADDVKNPLLGQCYFMRAFQYYKMVREHGGVPIIDKPQVYGEDDLEVERSSSKACFDFMVGDLDKAISMLPAKQEGSDYGRISKAAALAFKGRVLLLEASPLFNPNAPFNNSYVATALAANKEAFDFLNANGFGLADDYSGVFEDNAGIEAVLPVVYIAPNKCQGREPGTRPLSISKNATGTDMANFDLLEAFPMLDGKKIDEAGKYTYDMQRYWENRDPRFAACFAWNGRALPWEGVSGRRLYTAPYLCDVADCGGLSNDVAIYTRPGYWCIKGIKEELKMTEIALNDYDWIEIRYPEVWFNYAELANASGDQSVGYDCIKALRKRAGIEPGEDGMYGLKAGMTQEEMLQALLDEKRIEFCFEGYRFWDLRRNRKLDVLEGIQKWGCWATLDESKMSLDEAKAKAANYTLLPEDFNYERVDLWVRDKDAFQFMQMANEYFYPIPLSSIEKNPKLKQNSGWGGDFVPTL